ncbi:hypothetical protein Q7C_1037 [Methylophaga frappieri]|uniref:Uncharacterized protein n=1 Tax=Methylophaga frappieri (strain ATCC BAA-2434 / DSM 25690 / JAM7) TaxID=754477 RepID=I1YH03_METFJ|nr:hypothetical protein Q7C_1037 [Methylophaga frappieri]
MKLNFVHCRTGSLENHFFTVSGLTSVHCRTGSLEKPNSPGG